jgi:4-hydroxy-tetrahydrodipicolinate synthase
MIAALPTPFFEDESINFDAYKKLIDYVVGNGMHCVLAGGSTGEYHVMSLDERKAVIKHACEFAAGRAPVIAGTGRYTAKDTIDLTLYAADCGASAGLVLPPYYQTTSRQGIIDFYKEIAENVPIGIIAYNYPSATAVALDPELCLALAQIDGIVCIKDTDDGMHTAETVALTRDIEGFSVVNGFEYLLIPTLAIGAAGAMGITHNIVPKEMVQIYDLMMANDWKAAAEINQRLYKLNKYMELEPYPGPVKAALEMLGIEAGPVRKPLTQTSEGLKAKIREELLALGYEVKK